MTILRPYLTLCRLKLSVFAACSAATGFFLAPYHHVLEVLVPSMAVFFLAGGASALNQYQERDIDAKMERTRRRPIPSGSLAPGHALAFSLIGIIVGLLALVVSGGIKALVLGIAALIWYNGIYTYLKRKTAFAAVPGAAVGMAPPAIGWISAGGRFFDPLLFALCGLFFLWQIPHFWLLLLNHGEEYEKAGLPSLTRTMSKPQIGRVTFAWIVSASIAGLFLPLYGALRSQVFYCLLLPCAAWLIWSERVLTGRGPTGPLAPGLFKKINIYLFIMMSLISLDNIFFHRP